MAAEVAVIIGSGSIGVAIGRAAGIGRKVLLADYSEEAMNAVAGQFRGEGYEVSTHPIDISNHDAVAALADTAASLGEVTRVVLAAGVSPVQATTERVLHVDLLGTAYVLEEFGRVIAPAAPESLSPAWPATWATGYPREIEHALAYTPTAELLEPALPRRRGGRELRRRLHPRQARPTPCASALQPSPGVNAGPGSTASAPASSPPRSPRTRCQDPSPKAIDT